MRKWCVQCNDWGQVSKFTASDTEKRDFLGCSLSLSADTLVVGAYSEEAGGSVADAAYIFERNNGGADNWGETVKVVASDAEPGDYFGVSVSISGDTLIVDLHQKSGHIVYAAKSIFFLNSNSKLTGLR